LLREKRLKAQEQRSTNTPPEDVHLAIHGQAHPGPLEYTKIAVVLAAITLMEVGVYYVEAIEDLLIPILVVLSITKFALVAMWYMHLKFDSRLFSWLFVGGILLAASVFIAAWSTLDILLTT
jgi:cytochrome c oxidase subunit 4